MKKVLIIALGFVFLTPAVYAKTLMKECRVSMKELEEGSNQVHNVTFRVYLESGKLTSEKIEGLDVSKSEDDVVVHEGPVKDLSKFDLDSDEEIDKLSEVETFIVHAISTTSDPEMADYFSTGIDLTKVRSAKVYVLERASIGSVAIVEAKDASGKILGSFLGGFLVSPCK